MNVTFLLVKYDLFSEISNLKVNLMNTDFFKNVKPKSIAFFKNI